MARRPELHSYSDRKAFERLLLLIATMVQHPGVGCADEDISTQAHQSLEVVRQQMHIVAEQTNIALPNYSLATLRKDLETLRNYGILERRMYRWGYYLGTGALTPDELRAALQALATQAQHQGDPQIRRLFERLERRLRGLNLELDGQLFYPVRTHLSRTIVHTDPEDMMRHGHYRHTLFHQLATVEAAIATGQPLELLRNRDPNASFGTGHFKVYPLQLMYSDAAWYLLCEDLHSGHFQITRIDRLSDELTPLTPPRGITAQKQSLHTAHQLLKRGWGLYLGKPDEQQLELSGKLSLVTAQVRFFQPVASFILEGERRHPTQTLKKSRQGDEIYVDFSVQLPPRSLQEFSRWVNRFMHLAQIVTPPELAEKHRQNALALAQRYGHLPTPPA